MYSKIAFSNVKKSICDYTIYFLTLTFGICLFYMFNSVQAQQAVLKLNASQKSMMHLMSVIINGISVFVAIILGFLIVYANQFLMKRRHGNLSVVRNGKTTSIKNSSDRDFIDRCFGIDRRIGCRCVFITRTCDVDSKDVCGSDERV